jgi:two-component system, response regulator
MSEGRKPIVVLLADDDEEDRMLTCDALVESHFSNEICCVTDGEELMDYLHRRGKYTPPAEAPRPGIILLDLNMPRKDGREALKEIKSDPNLRQIPVVVLTTSKAEEDIFRSYDSGASSFICKPVTFEGLIDVMKGLGKYWFEIIDLPRQHDQEMEMKSDT